MTFGLRAFVLAFLLFGMAWLTTTPAQAASCADGTLTGVLETDQVLSGDHYMTGDVTLHAGAVLTLTPGSTITVCGDYRFWVQDAILIAEGTADAPIRFTTPAADQYWRGLYLGGGGVAVPPSRLQYVEVERGGKKDNETEWGAIQVYSPETTPDDGPSFDHVTVRDSATYGLHIHTNDQDATPVSLTNLTVTGSAAAPLMIYASAMSGLGTGHDFRDNGRNAIELRGGVVLGGRIYFSQSWPRQPIPFYVPDGNHLPIGHAANQPVVTIEAGNIFEMGQATGVRVAYGGLVVAGRADAPVVFRRAGVEPWSQILIDDRFSPSQSQLDYVHVSGAGHALGAVELYSGRLAVHGASIRDNTAAGLYAHSYGRKTAFLQLTHSTLSGNRTGVLFTAGANGMLRSNNLAGNGEAGVDNSDSRGSCIDAIGNFWGSETGPSDSSTALDDCGQTTTNSGGVAVTGSVRYTPWLGSADGSDLADASQLTPDPYWAVADGLDTVTVEVWLRDRNGVPLAGKTVQVTSSHGEVTQPAGPTDANGRTTATLRATRTGSALLTAHNVTDDRPIAAIAAVYFWQGSGDAGGLIDPQGAPYAAPELILEGQPFQQGVPLIFRLPMQNSNATPVEVSVSYAATGFGLGHRFTPVAEVSRTLQPGEQWDAPATWAPTESGHQCVRATLTFELPDGQVVAQELLDSNSTARQRNINNKPPEDPCGEPDATKLIPRGGLNGHLKNGTDQTNKVRGCINTIGFAAQSAAQDTDDRDYTIVATPPVYTPPLLTSGPDISQDQADAGNQVAGLAAEVAGLQVAIDLTLIRAQWAGQAEDIEATRRQLQALATYRGQLRAKLLAYAGALDAARALLDDDDNLTFTKADFAAYLAELKTTGYDAATLAYYKSSGLSDAAIASMLANEIAVLETQLPPPSTLLDLLARNAAAARVQAEAIPAQVQAAAAGLLTLDEQPAAVSFVVGNPTEARATVDLVVRPVALPVGWSYSLDQPAPELDPGATTTVTLTIVPNGPVLEGVVPQVAVEGFVGDEFVGGVLIRAGLPLPESTGAVYLPVLQQ